MVEIRLDYWCLFESMYVFDKFEVPALKGLHGFRRLKKNAYFQ